MYFLLRFLNISFFVFSIQNLYSREVRGIDDEIPIEYRESTDEETIYDSEEEKIHDKLQSYDNNNMSNYGKVRQNPLEIILKEGSKHKNKEFKLNSIIGDYVDSSFLNKSSGNTVSPLSLNKTDIRLERGNKGDYYDIVIRKRPYVNSVLLTNYYWHEAKGRTREYALRSLQYSSVNGNEKRLYKRMFIGKNQGLYFLIDSTPERDSQFGLAFRIRVPKYIVYGYRKGKEVYGVLRIKDGIKFNIRSFKRRYADYKGDYEDNPIILILNNRPLYIQDRPKITKIKEVLSEEYMGVYIEYESKQNFFKHFLVRGENEKIYSKVEFNNSVKTDQKAILLEAYYLNGIGRILKAVIYFKRSHVPKTFYISARDMNNLQSVAQIKIHVPAYYYDSKLLQNSPDYKSVWHGDNKVDF